MATKMPELTYSCEICGLEGLNDEAMRAHVVEHLGNTASCPFCDMTGVSANEMLVHVNTSHLEYLTPENELLTFIDDETDDDCTIIENEPAATCNGFYNHMNNNNENENTTARDNNNDNDQNSAFNSLKPNAQGSPMRNHLKLELSSRKRVVTQTCPLCIYSSVSPMELEEHINREHFDPTSPSVSLSGPSNTTRLSAFTSNDKSSCSEDFMCPLCAQIFTSSPDLEMHVNTDHRDILSPPKQGRSTRSSSVESFGEQCPVCCRGGFSTNGEMAAHIEEHFTTNSQPPGTPRGESLVTADRMLAREMDHHERESRRAREQAEFEMLRAQFGMDNQGNFKEQSLTNMQRAVYAGEMSVADYYERQIELRMAENTGLDDGSSCTRGLIPRIRALSAQTANVTRTLLCSTVDHYASTYGDKGWGCGYRNLQMMISSLMHHTGYNEQLYNTPGCIVKNGTAASCALPNAMPSISRLQQHIESAWKQGFDPQGADQLGQKLHNTRKWIGATEIVTALSSLRIRCQLVDFHRPTDVRGCHPELFAWVLDYFQQHLRTAFTPPLYLQHQGHSRTIVGVEVRTMSSDQPPIITLIVFDPSHTPQQMAVLKHANNANISNNDNGGMRLIRKNINAMKAKQYQIVAACGVMESEQDYQDSKYLRSTRIPTER